MGAIWRNGCLCCPQLPCLRLGLCAYVYIIFVLSSHWSSSASASSGWSRRHRHFTTAQENNNSTHAMAEEEESHVHSAQDTALKESDVVETQDERSSTYETCGGIAFRRPVGCGDALHAGQRSSNCNSAEATAAPPESAKAIQTKIYKLMKALHGRYPRMTTSSQMRRILSLYVEEVNVPGQDALASFISPLASRGQHLEVIESLFPSGQRMLANSAFVGGSVEVKWDNGFLSARIHDSERRYRPFLLCHDFQRNIRADVVKGIEEALASELQIVNACKLDSLENVQRTHHLLTLKDVLLLPGDKPFIVSSNIICANAVLLFDETVASLSSLLPLTDESAYPVVASPLEAARLSLFLQISGIVGSLAAAGLVLPRFFTSAFFVKATGTVYMKSHPQPRRLSKIRRAPKLRRFSLLSILSGSTLTASFNRELNAFDLATVLFNIWCTVKECLLDFVSGAAEARIRTIAVLAARGMSIPPLVLVFIRDLIDGKLTTEGILEHHAYVEISGRFGK